MEINIKFNTEFELERVKNTIKKLDWFDEQGYRPRLPEGINKESTDEQIKDQILKEFDQDKYKKVAQDINSSFLEIKKEFTKKLNEIFSKDIPQNFTICLTNYGVSGSYNLPDLVVYNINNKKGFKTILHEITHLIIEPWVLKYKVAHWEKERIVDLILNSKEFKFLDYGIWQGDYCGSEKYVDILFDQYFFKNPKNFFSKIESVRL